MDTKFKKKIEIIRFDMAIKEVDLEDAYKDLISTYEEKINNLEDELLVKDEKIAELEDQLVQVAL